MTAIPLLHRPLTFTPFTAAPARITAALRSYRRDRRFTALSHSRDLNQLMLVASASTCPTRVLTRLSEMASAKVREAVASNPATPALVLEQLASPAQPLMVRLAVAVNPACPEKTFAALCCDPFLCVAEAAMLNPAAPGSAVIAGRQYLLNEGLPTHSFHGSAPRCGCGLVRCSANRPPAAVFSR